MKLLDGVAVAGGKDIELGSFATPRRLRSTVRGIGIDRSRDDPADRPMKVAGVVLVLLIVGVLGANVLWVLPSPTGPGQPHMPPGQSPFPIFRMGPMLHVVSVEPGANLSSRLLLTSLQGLVNRDGVELYLDQDQVKGNTSAMLSFLASRYNVSYDTISPNQAIDAYANRAHGLVVFDPSRPESIDIGTMIAAQMGWLLVGPDLAGWVAARTGLPVLFDYASRTNWSSLGAIGAYDRALRELYPSSTPTLLAILPPDRWAIRDYLIATKTFVFYFPQGILARPAETAATKRILHATPRGIPILGWFNSPTLTEENSFVQMASAEGKFVVGGQEVPNLSVLTALGRNETRSQRSPAPPLPSLENKAYVVLAVPDGDNLDFVTGRMRDLWSETARGTVPVAWSLNPLLSELAPPMLDMYYDTATPFDRFIAAPSGAGYLYPDYADPTDLASFVAFSKRYMNASDMDVVWLLNAFTASEIPYSSRSLATYVDGLRPDGIVLDYDDQPRTRDAWVQAGDQAVAPIVRSTHFWSTRDNVLGKLDASVATWEPGPHFLWLTVYTFRFDLRDALGVVEVLKGRLGDKLALVTPGQFFGLMRQDFVQLAHGRLGEIEENPFASALFRTTLDSVRSDLREADSWMASGNPDRAAEAAFRGLEDLRAVSTEGAFVLSLGILGIAGVLAFFAGRSRKSEPKSRSSIQPGVVVFVATLVAFFMFSLREALEQNFWTYPDILIGIVFAGIHRPLGRWMDRAYPREAPLAGGLVALVLISLAIRTTAAFPLALIGALLALDTWLRRRPATAADLTAGLGFGSAIGFLGDFEIVTFTALAVLLVFSAVLARGRPLPNRVPAGGSSWFPGFLLALSLFGIAAAFYYSLALRLGVQGDLLLGIAGTLLVLGPTLAILVRRMLPSLPPRTAEIVALAGSALFSGILLVVHGTVLTVLVLLGLGASLSFAALASIDEYTNRGGEPHRALATALLFLPLLVMFFRMPPIVYSLTVVPLPEPIEYALYAPSVLLGATCIFLVAVLAVRGRRRAPVGKDYRAEADGGPVVR